MLVLLYTSLPQVNAYLKDHKNSINQVDGFHDSYTEWNKVWLPEERMVLTFGVKETPRLRTIIYSDFEQLKK